MYKEKVHVEEKLTVYIKDTKTGKIKTIVVKEPYREMSLWKKIKFRLGLLKQPGTLTTYGKEYAAKLWGGLSGGYSIDRLGAYSGTWTWKTVTGVYSATGIITFSNQSDPWGNGAWTLVGCKNSALSDVNRHNSINVNVTISGGSLQWWVEVQFTFS